ncbi:MAG: hypothetical protein J0H98_09750 [Solirubrobacterales bacterium]|nr:hypothetical protein [Solirubrobacterales bacterium]
MLIPFLALRAALGPEGERLREPVALAPQHDEAQLLGEVSPTAHELGVRPGMRLSEAIDICPELRLVTPDPGRAAEAHERTLARLESVGAGVESDRDGEAFFDSTGIERLHGGVEGVLSMVAERLGPGTLIAAAPTRLTALALARRLSHEESPPVRVLPPEPPGSFLSSQPVTLLNGRLPGPERESRHMLLSMIKLGLKTLGDLSGLTADAVADRFGPLGLTARRLALGQEESIRPRRPQEPIREWLSLPEASTGSHLRGGLTILCDRLSGRLRATGSSARTMSLEARLSDGGSWSREVCPPRPTASPTILRLLLLPAVDQLPRPAERLGLRVLEAAPAEADQIDLIDRPEQTRRLRLNEAARQVRATVGDRGLMRVLEVEPGSRLPERRMLLTPFFSE